MTLRKQLGIYNKLLKTIPSLRRISMIKTIPSLKDWKMKLQLFADEDSTDEGAGTDGVGESTNEPIDEGVGSDEGASSDFSFDIQFDKNPYQYTDEEELRKDAQLGKVTPRIQAKLDEANKILAESEKIAKIAGYENLTDFNSGAIERFKKSQEHQLIAKGLDPHEAKEIVDLRYSVNDLKQFKEGIEEQTALSEEAERFQKAFKDVDINTIPQSVYETQIREGISLTEAYARYDRDTMEERIRKDVIDKIRQNGLQSMGGLGQGNTQHQGKKKYKDMSDKDFAKVKEQALAGQLIR